MQFNINFCKNVYDSLFIAQKLQNFISIILVKNYVNFVYFSRVKKYCLNKKNTKK